MALSRQSRAPRRLRIGIIDIVENTTKPGLYTRIMNANFAGVMPQAIGVWCEQMGHQVHLVCYTGVEDLTKEFPDDLDFVFVAAFTTAAHLAYALSNLFRSRGAITVLGGPHARCYPEDAQRFFDHVLGFTDRTTIEDVLADDEPHRPMGRSTSAAKHPLELPMLEERWKYVEANMKKAPWFQLIPMLGSLGCPYTCSFCIDSTVDYQPLGFERMAEDLRFLLTKKKDPIVGWHDPNFGVRFDDYMDAIEEAVPQGKMRHVAESSLSLMSEPHLKRLAANGFGAILPGIESWYDMGNKAKTRQKGMEKVKQVSEHVNLIMRYIPYVQTNFVLGMDTDQGDEPFELTKRFLELTPGAFPAYSLLSAFGRAAPLNLDYQRNGRILNFPFGTLDNNRAMNVRPLHYEWREFYDNLVDLTAFSFSWKRIARRFAANRLSIPRWLNVVRAISTEGHGRLKYHTELRSRLDTDPTMLAFLQGESDQVPAFYTDRLIAELGSLAQYIPEGGMVHDPLAYLKSTEAEPALVSLNRSA
jgi:hypothetical protein